MGFLAQVTTTGQISKSDIALGSWWSDQFTRILPMDVIQVLIFALISSVVISLVYRKTYRGVLYNPTFSTTLILLTLVTAPVVMVIGSNVALSMGMVGALSIVRFRTAVKDPIDTAYMFWSITMGIVIGSKLYIIALIVVALITVMMIALSFVRMRTNENYLLVLHYDPAAEQEIDAELHRGVKNYRIRSKTITRSGAEMTVDLRLNQRADIVSHMLDIQGVYDATLVAVQNETAV
ncbi:MAG: DUF4956 domain-containing protein [Clostridiales bacterium]|jgi:uncharacterized membrane protein YhiD involved in acid resistance|nr:DUF4956 domain-containing protein [Clostridiales bacterium]